MRISNVPEAGSCAIGESFVGPSNRLVVVFGGKDDVVRFLPPRCMLVVKKDRPPPKDVVCRFGNHVLVVEGSDAVCAEKLLKAAKMRFGVNPDRKVGELMTGDVVVCLESDVEPDEVATVDVSELAEAGWECSYYRIAARLGC